MDRVPLNVDRLVVLNCGLGRDSITMLCLCLEGRLRVEGLGTVLPSDLDAVVFSDTGAEWAHTYALIDRIRALCASAGVRFVVLAKGDGEATAPSSWDEIEAKAASGGYHLRPGVMRDFESRATVASLGKGDCTDNHKIQPIRRFLSDVARVRFGVESNRRWSAAVRRGERRPHVTLIGIAADETSRLRNGAGRGPAYVVEAYPLVDLGIAKPDEAPTLLRWGLGSVRKSGCFLCPYQPAGWFWALSVEDPATFAAVVSYEATALARNPRMHATGFKRPIPEVVARWRAENPDATVEAVLTKEYARCR